MTEQNETICVLIDKTGDLWRVCTWTERDGRVPVPDLPMDRNKVRVWMWARQYATHHGYQISNAPWTDGQPGYPTRRFPSQGYPAAGIRREGF
jgi:hypothetical protein